MSEVANENYLLPGGFQELLDLVAFLTLHVKFDWYHWTLAFREMNFLI